MMTEVILRMGTTGVYATQQVVMIQRLRAFRTMIVAVLFLGLIGVALARREGASTQTPKEGDQSSQKLTTILADHSFRLKEDGEDPHRYVQDEMGVCYQRGSDDCYRNVATLFFAQFSLPDILGIFADSETVPEVFARCHQVTHYLARTEYLQTKSLPGLFNSCNFTCHGGCYHGAIEEYLQERKLLTNQDERAIREEISSICGKKEQASVPQVFRECVHGLGHGTMYISDGDLFQALDLCDALGDQGDRDGCYSGVFMENSSSSTNTTHPGRFLRRDDPMYPCTAVGEPYRRMCYRYQSSYFAEISNHDWKKTGDLCMNTPLEFRRECFQTIGTNQVGFTQDFKVMRANCQLIPEAEFQDACIAGIVVSLTGRYVGQPERALEFCSLVAPAQQRVCYSQMGRSIADWSTDENTYTEICSMTPYPTTVKLCVDGATEARGAR